MKILERMKTLINPTEIELKQALTRPALESATLETTISGIFEAVKSNGDKALIDFTQRFDGAKLTDLRVSDEAIELAIASLDTELKNAIMVAAENIATFHQSQQHDEPVVETTQGVSCWRKSHGIDKVGLYIPGGSAPLFSTVLMLGIPARIAGCKQRILCTPPYKDGTINPAILFAARVAGIQEIYAVGGAQAIAAMAIGTESVPKVYKIFGPGNQYVTAAKQYAMRLGLAIDMPAGPSEVMVVADDSIPAEFVAADLLAQAEHGADSQVVLVTDKAEFVKQVEVAVSEQLKRLPRAEIALGALENSVSIVVPVTEWSTIINVYAPEHLILMGKYEAQVVAEVTNAGSIFLGQYTAESFGDYASGTNHTLPTAGFARAYSGVSLDSFVKKVTYQRVNETGLKNLGNVVITMAKAEELDAHAAAIEVRLKSLN